MIPFLIHAEKFPAEIAIDTIHIDDRFTRSSFTEQIKQFCSLDSPGFIFKKTNLTDWLTAPWKLHKDSMALKRFWWNVYFPQSSIWVHVRIRGQRRWREFYSANGEKNKTYSRQKGEERMRVPWPCLRRRCCVKANLLSGSVLNTPSVNMRLLVYFHWSVSLGIMFYPSSPLAGDGEKEREM